VDYTAAMIARFSSDADAKKACGEYGLPIPKSAAEARLALYAYADQGGAEAHFLFDLAAAGPVVQFAENAPITAAVARKVGAAVGLPESGISALQRLASSGKLKRFDVTDLPAMMGFAAKRMAEGHGAAEAVRFSVAQFAPADADANGVRSEELPGSHRLVAVNHGAGPVVVVAESLSGTGPQRRVPIDPNALADWPTFRAAVSAGSAGQVQLVRPDIDAAVPGCPQQLFAPVPTGTGNGKITKHPGGMTVGMSARMNDIDLATHRALAALNNRKETLARTLSREGLSADTASSSAVRQAAEDAFWQIVRERSDANHVEQVQAVMAAQKRERALEATALGRQILEQERSP
jgi:hypothetical protein